MSGSLGFGIRSEVSAVESTYRHLKDEWRDLWDQKIDDKWLAESLARREYALLFVGEGDVVSASRKARSPDFREILETHERLLGERLRPIDPNVGNWGKFIREEIMGPRMRKRPVRRMDKVELARNGQPKKGGRGWLHVQ
jgi:hypothetical protein